MNLSDFTDRKISKIEGMMNLIDFHSQTRLVFGPDVVDTVGQYVAEWNARRVLVVTDPHIVQAGHVDRAVESLRSCGLEAVLYDQVRENPTTRDVESCLQVAREGRVDSILGIGGGSSLDTAKGCNFLLTNGGQMRDYWGVGKATRPMLPLIAVPTTAGTGSETQSFALIADEHSHQKMACGDKKAAARVALLDPTLTLTQPPLVTAVTGMDTLGHALETGVTRQRNPLSLLFSSEALRLVLAHLPTVLAQPDQLQARGQMQLAAAFAGIAIENSMLGAAHSAANPLTAHFDVIHGQAVGLMLPAVVRLNAGDPETALAYREMALHARLVDTQSDAAHAVEALIDHSQQLLELAGLASTLSELGIPRDRIPDLASEASTQWTAQFNPRSVGREDFEQLYQSVLGQPTPHPSTLEHVETPMSRSTDPIDDPRYAVRPLPAEAENETRGGGYFVSNYPPFSYWNAEARAELETAFTLPPEAGRQLGLYVHIPFCRKRCHFCYFKVYTDKNAQAIGQYVDALASEAAHYARQPFVDGRALQFVYFGGGTPSYLSEKQLRRLTEALQQSFPWDQAAEVAFECEPGTLGLAKLQALREMGVTRLSLGIENFNDSVLEANNRAHNNQLSVTAYAMAREVGFAQINIDLIAGMLEETQENWVANIDKTIELSPDSVTVYQMEVPFNTTIYRDMSQAGQLKAPLATWDVKRRWVKYAFDRLEAAGYHVSSAYTAVKKPETTQFVYRDSLWTGADMIATGVSSFGHAGGVHYQNEKHFDPYLKTVESGQLPLFRALRTTGEEAMVRELVLQMKLGRVDADYFQDKFHEDILSRFSEVWHKYQGAGLLTVDSGRVTLERDLLLQVDQMLHEFFLPQHREPAVAAAS